MMIEVHYFASIRERLGCDMEVLAATPALTTVNAVIDALVQKHGEPWAKVLCQGRVLVAVNQLVSELNAPVTDGDEVAFFPPVTGG